MATVQRREVKKKIKPTGPRVDEKLMGPGDYEITEKHTFDVDVYLAKKGNRWIVVEKGLKTNIKQTVVFRIWTYDEMIELRKQSTSFDAIQRMHMVDTDNLDRMKVQKLMQSWTFGENNPRLKIHRVQGVLTDESWISFKKLQANIIRFILEKMNEVLEYNG